MCSSKLRVLSLLVLIVPLSVFSQAPLPVMDGTALAQDALNFCDQMDVAVEQRSALFKQMEQMLEQSKMMKEGADKFKKCMDWVKKARSVVSLLDKTNTLRKNYKTFYSQLGSCDYLSVKERKNLMYNANLLVSEASDVYDEVKTIVGEFKGEGDAGLSSYERIQLVERISEKLDGYNQKLEIMKSYANQIVKGRRKVRNMTMGVYNQFCPSECRIEDKNGVR